MQLHDLHFNLMFSIRFTGFFPASYEIVILQEFYHD